jgi:hypothetical protein
MDQVMKELAETKDDLGTYEAKAGEGFNALRAKMKLTAELRFIVAGRDPGSDHYFAEIEFRKLRGDPRFSEFPNKVNEKGREDYVLTLHYNSSSLTQIFDNLKKAATGVETLLSENHKPEGSWFDYWLCLRSLEEQIQHLYVDRQKAEQERRKKVYGN